MGGTSIGLPPVLNFGSRDLVARIAPDVLHGRKRMALAISEPYTGSDVKQIRTTAERTKDGGHYVVTVRCISQLLHHAWRILVIMQGRRRQENMVLTKSLSCVLQGVKKWITGGKGVIAQHNTCLPMRVHTHGLSVPLCHFVELLSVTHTACQTAPQLQVCLPTTLQPCAKTRAAGAWCCW